MELENVAYRAARSQRDKVTLEGTSSLRSSKLSTFTLPANFVWAVPIARGAFLFQPQPDF